MINFEMVWSYLEVPKISSSEEEEEGSKVESGCAEAEARMLRAQLLLNHC
jgi:hypothetical protein